MGGHTPPPGRGASLKMDSAPCCPSVTTAVAVAIQGCSHPRSYSKPGGRGAWGLVGDFPYAQQLSSRPAALNVASFIFATHSFSKPLQIEVRLALTLLLCPTALEFQGRPLTQQFSYKPFLAPSVLYAPET